MYSVVGGDGQVYGPVPVETIKDWAAQGRVAGRTSLIDPISGRVLRAEDLDELRDVFLPAPPVAPTVQDAPPPAIGQHPFAAPEQPQTATPFSPPAEPVPGPPAGPPGGFGAVQQPRPYPGPPQHTGVGGYPARYAALAGQQVAHSPKSKVAALLLCFFLGMVGGHRFYLGYTGAGIAMLLMTVLSFGLLWPVTFIWAVVDLIMISTGSLRDPENRPLSE